MILYYFVHGTCEKYQKVIKILEKDGRTLWYIKIVSNKNFIKSLVFLLHQMLTKILSFSAKFKHHFIFGPQEDAQQNFRIFLVPLNFMHIEELIFTIAAQCKNLKQGYYICFLWLVKWSMNCNFYWPLPLSLARAAQLKKYVGTCMGNSMHGRRIGMEIPLARE